MDDDARRHSLNDGNLAFDEDITDVPVGLVFEEGTSAGRAAAGGATANNQTQSHSYGDYSSQPLDYSSFNLDSSNGGSVLPPAASGAPLPPLVSQTAPAAPVKRPRGRPRKVPGTESRPTAISTAPKPTNANHPRSSGATGRPRGRPKGSRGTRGAKSAGGTKRSREEEEISEEEREERERERRDQAQQGYTMENGQYKLLDTNEEAPDDFDASGERLPNGPTTKFGRKVTKPQPYVPQTKAPTKKKARPSSVLPSAAPHPHADLTCQVCKKGHSPAPNQLVLCELCDQGWHQLCADPAIDDRVVGSDKAWHCRACDAKRASAQQIVNVTQGPWTDGQGTYSPEMKQEWLESLPLTSLVGYILSVEQKFAQRFQVQSLDIWPQDLNQILLAARAVKAEADTVDGTTFDLATPANEDRKPTDPVNLAALNNNPAPGAPAAPLSRSVFGKQPFPAGAGGPSPGPDSPNSRQSPLAGSVHHFGSQHSPLLHQPQPHHPHQPPPQLPQMGAPPGPPGGGGGYNPTQARAPLPSFMREPNPGGPFGGGAPQPGQGMHSLMSQPQPGQQGGYAPHQPAPYAHLQPFRGGYQQPAQLNTNLPFPGYAPGPAGNSHSPLLSGSPHQSPQLGGGGSGAPTRSPHLGHGRGQGSGGGSVGHASPQVGHDSQFTRPPSSAGSMANVLGGGPYVPNGRPTPPMYAYNGAPPPPGGPGGGGWGAPSSLLPSHAMHQSHGSIGSGGHPALEQRHPHQQQQQHHQQQQENPAYSPDMPIIGGFGGHEQQQQRGGRMSVEHANGGYGQHQGQPLGGPQQVQERERWSFSGSSQGGGQ